MAQVLKKGVRLAAGHAGRGLGRAGRWTLRSTARLARDAVRHVPKTAKGAGERHAENPATRVEVSSKMGRDSELEPVVDEEVPKAEDGGEVPKHPSSLS